MLRGGGVQNFCTPDLGRMLNLATVLTNAQNSSTGPVGGFSPAWYVASETLAHHSLY